MSSKESLFLLFQISSTIAVLGFLTLLAEVLFGLCRKPRAQQNIDSTVTLSAVSSGDEPEKPTIPDGGSTGLAKTEADQGEKRSPRDRIDRIDRLDALRSQIRSTESDTNPFITDVAATYMLAAEDLLKLRREADTEKSRADLYVAARWIVQETTADTDVIPLVAPMNSQENGAAIVIWSLSGLAGWLALVVAGSLVQALGVKHLDLTRFTLRGDLRQAPGTACSLPQLLGHGIPVVVHAFRCVTTGLSSFFGLVGSVISSVIMFPANAAFDCLVSGFLLAGVPLSIGTVAVMSFLALFAVLMLTRESARHSLEAQMGCR
ncbi:hypothetical protein Daus18300_010349 [Diaporthe australafricana]|uniref:Integral membrane protein n=1 Tax=Diaporthe australafricana TaxID=127596 RepID=A0ABR3WB84_9PEZI